MNLEGVQKPLDFLNKNRGRRVLVILKSGEKVSGDLVTFDIHLNIVLSNATILRNGGESVSLGKVLIRGDNILFISSE